MLVTVDPEQVTPGMEQQAVGLVGSTEVSWPISCHDRTTQQHCEEDASQVVFTQEVDRQPNLIFPGPLFILQSDFYIVIKHVGVNVPDTAV